MLLDNKDLNHIVNGAAFLGSGGGGSIDAGKRFVAVIIRSRQKVELITFPLQRAVKNSVACIVCDIGSIGAFDKKQDQALLRAFNSLNAHFRPLLGDIQALFPIETGPENTLAALVVGAMTNKPVIDGDGAGRAIPTIPLCSFSSAVEKPSNWRPVSIANGKGDLMLVNSSHVEKFDMILRTVAATKTFESSGSLALWPDKVKTLAKKCIPGTITRALNFGRLLEGIVKRDKSAIKQSLPVVNTLRAYLIGAGKVTERSKDESNAFQFTVVTVENTNKDKLTILGQNESLIVFSDGTGVPLATAPDSICYLSHDFEPLTNVEIKKGQAIYIIGIKPDKKLLCPKSSAGFKRVLLELGYAGRFLRAKRKCENLGDLVVRLSKSRVRLK